MHVCGCVWFFFFFALIFYEHTAAHTVSFHPSIHSSILLKNFAVQSGVWGPAALALCGSLLGMRNLGPSTDLLHQSPHFHKSCR